MRLRWVYAMGLGLGLVAACATGSSPLARRGEGDGAGQGGTAGGAGKSGSSGQAGAGKSGASGQGGAAQGGSSQGGASGTPAGGSAGTPSAGAAGASAGGGLGGSAGGPVVVNEPDGPTEFRLLNGIADGAAVRVCWLPWKDEAPTGVDATPQPSTGAMEVGAVVTPVFPEGFDGATTALRPHVIAGDLLAAEGQGCLALVAQPPPGLRVTPLPIIPPGSTTAPRSRLAVLVGCAGGLTTDPLYTCGAGVGSLVGNLGLMLVELSRIAPAADRTGLQFIHASTALPTLRLQALAVDLGAVSFLVGPLSLTQIAPRPPLGVVPDTTFGLPLNALLKVFDVAQGLELASFDLATSLVDSGLTFADIAPGRGVVGVVMGPKPGAPVDAALVAPLRVRWLRAPTLDSAP